MKIRVLLLIALAGLLMIACQPQAMPGSGSATPAESPASPEASPTSAATTALSTAVTPPPRATNTATAGPEREDRLLTPPPKMPEPIPTLEEQMPVTGEVPQDLLQQMIDDLSERLEVSPESIAVQRAEEVVWRDGSLGCPQPGQAYTQALVHGYRVTLTVGDQAYDYHANDSGYFFLCENPAPPLGGPPGGSSDR